MNNKRVLSGGYWILFSNPPLKFELDKVEDVVDVWVRDVRIFE
jgi:hypothetical protein